MTKAQTFAEAVAKLKAEIGKSVALAVSEFRHETGMTPSDIDIRMEEVTSWGDEVRVFNTGGVNLRFDA